MLTRRGKVPTLLLITILVTALVIGGGFLFMKRAASGEGVSTVQEASKVIIPLDEFIVNLADKREPRYLKVEMCLEMRGDRSKEEAKKLKPKVRDKVIQVLSSKYYADLLDPTGKEALKNEIRESLDKTFEDCKVVGVFFTSFAMQ